MAKEKKKNPFDAMLDQFANILGKIDEKKGEWGKGAVDEEVDGMVDKLEGTVKEFRKISDKFLDELGIDVKEKQEKLMKDWDKLPLKYRRMLERAKNLRDEAARNRDLTTGAISIAKSKAETPPEEKTGKKKTKKKRTKKFDRLGAKKDWKPL